MVGDELAGWLVARVGEHVPRRCGDTHGDLHQVVITELGDCRSLLAAELLEKRIQHRHRGARIAGLVGANGQVEVAVRLQLDFDDLRQLDVAWVGSEFAELA